jgi:transposase-like protein
MRSPFDDEPAAREFLEALRWPDGPTCPRCGSRDPEAFRIGGEKRSHRDGLYQCKPCRRQFSVTVGTVFERLRVPLSTWVRSAHAFSDDLMEPKPLVDLQTEIGVSYRTVLRMRDVIKFAASKYKGYPGRFGAWPRTFMTPRSATGLRGQKLLAEGKHPSQRTISSTGVLAGLMRGRAAARKRAAFDRTEQLLRLLLASAKP